MKLKIVILPDGQLSAFVESGTFENGKAKIENLIAALGADGIKFSELGKVEQHRHADQNVTNTNEVKHG